ncbi:hypothetical protein [Massilia orientalis]|uniref:Uncharacterized protein n=1 Tax=Massilia orientalis TaxID=3050128 RepID=A0ACC7MDR0_9BURK|nr:hypothetical protein [Massilia sp. YIM B02787]
MLQVKSQRHLKNCTNKYMDRTPSSRIFNAIAIAIAGLTLASAGCTDKIYKQNLARDWDCGTYQLSLGDGGNYSLVAPTLGLRYSGTYQIKEALGGGHVIEWNGEPNSFTKEHTFIQGPSSDRQMAMGRDAGTTATLCSARTKS